MLILGEEGEGWQYPDSYVRSKKPTKKNKKRLLVRIQEV